VPNVGYATIQIIPSVRGIGDQLRSQLMGPAEDAGEDAGVAAGGSLKEKLVAGAAIAGVAAGAVLVAGITEAIDQAGITKRLQAQLGATGQDAARYGKIAGQLYSKGITDSVQEGADAIRAVVNAGLVSPDATNAQLESIAGKMSSVATTFQSDMEMQTQAVAAMFKNGLAPSAEDALDIITVGLQKLGPNAEDLLETFQEYSIQFRKLGIDAKTALGLFQQGIAGGARDTDIIADAFKEFSIRAIDMSESSQDAYKALGLDAEAMSLQIAKGGADASAGLQLVLDKLRGMADPVEQNAAAVGLFGTQAEDMGSALFKLDPAAAVGALGEVAGAAEHLGHTLHSGPTHELEVFARTVKQRFVELIAREVLPVLTKVIHVFNVVLVPPLRVLASVLAAVLVPAFHGLIAAGVAIVRWLQEFGVWLLPVAIAVGGVTLALTAQAIVVGTVTAIFSAYRAVILAWMAVQRAGIAIQAAFNAVMAANPVILIITAILALGAALVIAYKRSETFRAIVQGAWEGIQAAALWAWERVLKPAFEGFMTGMRAVGDAAVWLWDNAIKPAFSAIATAAQTLATIFITVFIAPTIFAIKLLAPVFTWLWQEIIKPAFDGIASAAMWVWENGIKPAFGQLVALVRFTATVIVWFWESVTRPVFSGIAAGALWLWQNGIKPAFDEIMRLVRVLGSVMTWLWSGVVRPAWDGIVAAINGAWQYGIKPAFDFLKRGIDGIRDSFNSGVSGISKIWDGLKDVARKPVQYVVDVVYNDGLRKVWNTVADFTGAKHLSPLKFASGGSVFGAGTATSDSIPALLSNGEHVWTAAEVRGAGGHAAVEALRASALRGGSAFAKGGAVGVPRFAEGGVVDWLTGAARKIGGAVMTGIEFVSSPGRAWDTATQYLRDQIRSGLSGSQWAQALSQFPLKMLRDLKDKVVSAAESLIGGGNASGNVAAAMAFARSQAGKPYQWGGAGNPSWDCSGFMSGIQKVILGQSPYGRLWSTFSFQGGTAPAGWHRGLRSPFMIGITNEGVGHTAGTLGGMNVESRGGDGVVVGNRARGYNSPLFHDWYGFAPALKKFDDGGWLQPGLTLAYNATGRPEPVLTSGQWTAMNRGGGASDQRQYTINLNGSSMTSEEQAASLMRRLEFIG
jgi:phage-related minor tail protein